MVNLGGTVIGADELALVVVHAQVVVQWSSLPHDVEVAVLDLEGTVVHLQKTVDDLHGVCRVVPVECRVEQELVGEDVLVLGRKTVFELVRVVRVLGLEDVDDADLAVVATFLVGDDRLGVRDHHVVHALNGLDDVALDASGEVADDVLTGHDRPGLVDRDPVRDLVLVLLEAERGIVHERVDGLPAQEVTLLEQRVRRVEVVQRHEGLDATTAALLEEPVIEGHSLGIRLADALGEDARPGNGDTDPVDAILARELEVDRILVVEVARGVG